MSYHESRAPEYKFKRCSAEGCENKFDDHKGGAMKAQREGWFMQKDGTAWCPDHTPDWVEGWRKRHPDPKERQRRR